MLVDVVTLFPGYLSPLSESLLGRARQRGLLEVRVHDLRTWGAGVHRAVDDAPYGGGPGMLMRPEPWAAALDAVIAAGGPAGVPRLLLPSPGGRLFTQSYAEELATEPWLAFGCGRYEGIDARVAEAAADRMRVDEVSVGDYVLAGGEAAALVIVEAVARLLPGVLGNPGSAADDSHTAGLLEAPTYTRPAVWAGRAVPSVLLSGDHAAVARWRRAESLRRTAHIRPELLATAEVTDAERRTLEGEGFRLPDGDVTK